MSTGDEQPPVKAPTAAIVVIGDEILTGKYRDENSPWLIDRCRQLGLDLVRIAVVPDVIEQIAEEVDRCRKLADWVFTSGGVGPTHDDLTMSGIAHAFGVGLERRQELVDILTRRFGDALTDDALRMADLPVGADLWWDGEIFFPQVVVANVVIFPGVPGLLRMKFDAICDRLGGIPVHTARLRTSAAEAAIAHTLRLAQERWPQVRIGSYPRYETRPWTVVVILDSRQPDLLAACRAWLQTQLADQLVEDGAFEAEEPADTKTLIEATTGTAVDDDDDDAT